MYVFANGLFSYFPNFPNRKFSNMFGPVWKLGGILDSPNTWNRLIITWHESPWSIGLLVFAVRIFPLILCFMQNDSFKRIACNNVLASTPPFLKDMFCSLYSYVSYRVLNQLILLSLIIPPTLTYRCHFKFLWTGQLFERCNSTNAKSRCSSSSAHSHPS